MALHIEISMAGKVFLTAKEILFRWPLFIFYCIVIGIILKHRKTKFEGPFYIQVVALAVADLFLFVYYFLLNFVQFMFDFGQRFNPTGAWFKFVNLLLQIPGSMVAPAMQVYIALLRMLAVTVPIFASVRYGYFYTFTDDNNNNNRHFFRACRYSNISKISSIVLITFRNELYQMFARSDTTTVVYSYLEGHIYQQQCGIIVNFADYAEH